MKKIISIFILSTILLTIFSCGPDDEATGGTADNYNRGAMLTNLADNIIIPAYQDFDTKLDALVIAKNNFTTTPNQINLDALRTEWLNAYTVWQHVEMFNIGKAEEIFYYFQMNIYPTNTTDIEANIASGTYDLTHTNNNDAVGFPAVDYLLYGVAANDVAIIAKYDTNVNAANYKTYLSDVINQMKNLTTTVLNDWTGAYRGLFVGSTGNTATSSANKLVNDYNFYFEKGLRTKKIGIPAGVFSTTPLPTKVEAFYNKEVSKVLTLEALTAAQNFFNGKHYGLTTTGESFEHYLNALEKVTLANNINAKFDNARIKTQALNTNYTTQITTDNTKMTDAYDALQQAVVLLKVEMMPAFQVFLDAGYIDNDGD